MALSNACADSIDGVLRSGMENDDVGRNHWFRLAMELVDNRFPDYD